MQVRRRMRSQSEQCVVHLSAPTAVAAPLVVSVNKSKLIECVQMLHKNECQSLDKSGIVNVVVENTGNNEFQITFHKMHLGQPQVLGIGRISVHRASWQTESTVDIDTAPHPSVAALLRYARAQILPRFQSAQAFSKKIQGTLGSVPSPLDAHVQCAPPCVVDHTFMRNNATTISKLSDIINIHTHSLTPASTFGPKDTARMLWLATAFCATAEPSKVFSLFNVTQLQMNEMPDHAVERVYEHSPEKHHLSMLLRGENADNRIKRFNLAVRIFPQESEFVRDILPKMIGLNATVYTPALVVTGVRNNQAAAIFLSSDSLNALSHSAAMYSFLSGL